MVYSFGKLPRLPSCLPSILPLSSTFPYYSLVDEKGISNWVGVGDPWYIPLRKNREIAKINEWDLSGTTTYKTNTLLR